MTPTSVNLLNQASRGRGNFKTRYARATIYSGLGGTVSQMLYGLTPVIVARLTNPRDYGIYAIVMSLVAIITGLLSLGQNSMLHKLLPEYAIKDRDQGGAILANTVLLTLGILVTVCAMLIAMSGWLATSAYGDPGLISAFRWAALATMAMSLFNLASSAVAGLQDFKTYNIGLLLRSTGLILFVWLGVQGFGLEGAIAGQMTANLLGLSLLIVSGWPLAHKSFPGSVRPSVSRPLLNVMAGFTLPALIMTLLNLPGYWWISTMLARHSGFAEAGFFSAAYTIAQLIFLAPLAIYTPAMTFLSEAHAAQQPDVFSRVAGSNLRWLWSLTLPLALGAALAAPLIIRSVFGSSYSDAVWPAFVMSLAALLMVNTGFLNTLLIASGRAWQGSCIALAWSAVFFAAGLLCIPRFGALGAASAFTASQIFYFAITLIYSLRSLRITNHQLLRLTALTIFSACSGGAIAYLFREKLYCLASAFLLIVIIRAEWRWLIEIGERRYARQIVISLADRLTAGFHKSLNSHSTAQGDGQ